jgi:glutamine amidotransferase
MTIKTTINRITVIDYGLGNLASVAGALKKLVIPYEVSGDINRLKNATALILPGVGAAGRGMENLKKRGIDQIIIEQAKKGTPILGICLGMQLLLTSSEEGNVDCLGLIEGKVKKFDTSLKVPQIGWNQVETNNSILLKGIKNNSYFYFVNSYYCAPDDENITRGITDYDSKFCSVLEKNNLYGVQFHPEKSGDVGLKLLKNFWEVAC